MLSKLPRVCCADFLQLCGIVLSKAGTSVLGSTVLLCGIVLSKLASMSYALQFCFAALCLARLAPNVLRAAIFYLRNSECLHSENFLSCVILWARRLVPHLRGIKPELCFVLSAWQKLPLEILSKMDHIFFSNFTHIGSRTHHSMYQFRNALHPIIMLCLCY